MATAEAVGTWAAILWGWVRSEAAAGEGLGRSLAPEAAGLVLGVPLLDMVGLWDVRG
jgi:hypothetical protein